MAAEDDRADRSDWTDQDLLTVGDAARRLDEEIATLTAELAVAGDARDTGAASTRLELLGRARARIAGGPDAGTSARIDPAGHR